MKRVKKALVLSTTRPCEMRENGECCSNVKTSSVKFCLPNAQFSGLQGFLRKVTQDELVIVYFEQNFI